MRVTALSCLSCVCHTCVLLVCPTDWWCHLLRRCRVDLHRQNTRLSLRQRDLGNCASPATQARARWLGKLWQESQTGGELVMSLTQYDWKTKRRNQLTTVTWIIIKHYDKYSANFKQVHWNYTQSVTNCLQEQCWCVIHFHLFVVFWVQVVSCSYQTCSTNVNWLQREHIWVVQQMMVALRYALFTIITHALYNEPSSAYLSCCCVVHSHWTILWATYQLLAVCR